MFFRGALASGDLPSKSGAAELRDLGFAETRHTATEYQQENYFTFLTAEGQAFAVEHLVNTRFGEDVGKKEDYAPLTIGIKVDISDAQKAIEILDKKIRESDAFKFLSGELPAKKKPELLGGDFTGTLMLTDNDSFNAMKITLSDNMKEAVVDAVRGSQLFLERHPGQSSVAFQADKFAVNDAIKSYTGEAFLCSSDSSGSIEQQTLSTVLGNALHSIPASNASSVAVELAQAVKAAFDVLENKNATTR